MKLQRYRLVLLFVSFVVLLFVWAAQAPAYSQHSHALDIEAFSKLPILHEGRVKPMDSFARIHLRRFYGEEVFGNKSAVEWLAETVFIPEVAVEQEVFKLPSPRLIKFFQLTEKEEKVYSYKELAATLDVFLPKYKTILSKPPAERTANEKAIATLYNNLDDYSQLIRSFSILQPLKLNFSLELERLFMLSDLGDNLNYKLMQPIAVEAEKSLQEIVRNKGDDVQSYTALEREIALLSFTLKKIALTGENNTLFRVIPSPTSVNGSWYSYWHIFKYGSHSEFSASIMQQWQIMLHAYRSKEVEMFNDAVKKVVETKLSQGSYSDEAVALEIIYNKLSLFDFSLILYLLALVSLVCHHFISKPIAGYALSAALIALLSGVCIHGLAIGVRIYLLSKPPVSTLYESVIFVAWVSAVYGYWISRKRYAVSGVFLGASLAALLLAVSDTYAGQGDTLTKPIAVLNTDFWLATHVVCITIGYATTLIAGTMAHLVLYKPDDSNKLGKMLPFMTVIALLFTAIGTILGGIWADQSWGRFWGWDPKENGALLIVLWLIWALHGRMTAAMGKLGFSALLAASNIVVALSWFGVNLLNVGLHSYGFTDSAAIGLAAFCLIELAIILSLYGRAKTSVTAA